MTRKELDRILLAARSAWQADGSALVSCQTDGFAQEAAANFATSLERSYAVGWDLILKSADHQAIQRTEQILNAPLYASAKYPWPSSDGMFATPILQLDLEWIEEVAGIEMGSGVVQLWHGTQGMIARAIPRFELLDLLEPLPFFVCGENLPLRAGDGQDEPQPRFLTNCHRVIEVAGPYIFGNSAHDEIMDSFIGNPITSQALRTALSLLRSEVEAGRERYRQVNRLFGSFDGLQTQPEDHPPVLFSSDDDSILDTGDAGIISLHFSAGDEGKICFSGNIQW